jgi:hypothetical protein
VSLSMSMRIVVERLIHDCWECEVQEEKMIYDCVEFGWSRNDVAF